MESRSAVVPAVIAALAMCLSCGRPSVSESFVRQSGRDSLGRYCFSLDLSDSMRSNSLYFYTMIDAADCAFREMPSEMPLHVELVSPAGKHFCEDVSIVKDSFAVRSQFSWQYELPYRTGFMPVEYGEWHMAVTVAGENRFPGLRGLGMRHIKEEN